MEKTIVYYWKITLDVINENFASGIERVEGYKENTEEIRFICKNGNIVTFYHEQDCCESVWLADADGLTNNEDIFTGCDWCKVEIVKGSGDALCKYDESYTWTFYKFVTNKGYDFMRWYGTSNGYYSESVDIKISRIEED